MKRIFFDVEAELTSKAYSPKHAQGVVAEGQLRLSRRADHPFIEVSDSPMPINQGSGIRPNLQRQSVNGEIATIEIIFKAAVFHQWLTGIGTVRLLSRPNKFNVQAV